MYFVLRVIWDWHHLGGAELLYWNISRRVTTQETNASDLRDKLYLVGDVSCHFTWQKNCCQQSASFLGGLIIGAGFVAFPILLSKPPSTERKR